jgi:hypothetical protein
MPIATAKRLADLFRAWPLWVWTLVFFAIVILLKPVQIGVFVWGLLKLSTAAAGGYWVDRIVFPYARPGIDPSSETERWWMLRRAIIMAAAILAMGANL